MQLITLDHSSSYFVERDSGRRFNPVGFNYDHDEHFRLIEEYWYDEWDKVLYDLDKMQSLGANTIRLHLQTTKFLPLPESADNRQLDQLGRFIETAASMGLYLNITGLGTYHSHDQPEWFTYQQEEGRWEIQAKFWQEVAKITRGYNNVFCLNLINEPVIAGGMRPPGAWLGNSFVDGKHYTQFVVLKGKGRDRNALARRWIIEIKEAVKEYDKEHLITLGMMDWCLERPPAVNSGFAPDKVADLLDFLSIHVYPVREKEDDFIQTVKAFNLGKPVVIEEFSHLDCEPEDLPGYLSSVRDQIEGIITFYTDIHKDPQTELQRLHAEGMQHTHDFFFHHGRYLFD